SLGRAVARTTHRRWRRSASCSRAIAASPTRTRRPSARSSRRQSGSPRGCETPAMLLCGDGQDLIAVGQPAHAWVSGQLARAWGNARFGELEPRAEVCLAAEQHDLGMATWERRPTLNPKTGLPRSFMELTLDEHLEIWWS